MRKVDDGEEKKKKRKEKKKEKKKIMTFIVATNVIASQPPERLSTGTPLDLGFFLSRTEVNRKFNSRN